MHQNDIPKDIDTTAIINSVICAPFPNMERKWTQEAIDKLDRALSEYYPE